ncbi:flagellar motor switch protein FliN [Hyphomicrobium sp.]|uniref:flagellar motor switch protein FliN n=1 Tax=Hyphomicrobium sp. TaxID=82 RepID=UPI0025BE1998|nr:flagellar motor switch protein FliN [Hyphomicrobium sp.]MCC7253291.1 flagellar motor switch protein FliN [Hyphomicrobium sp.]
MSQEDIRPAADELQTLVDPAQAEAPAEVAPKAGAGQKPRHLETVLQIPVSVKVVLGSASMPVASVLKLGRGAVVPLDRKVGEPVDVVVNGRVIARGEVVVLDEDNSRFGVSLTEVLGATAPTRVA